MWLYDVDMATPAPLRCDCDEHDEYTTCRMVELIETASLLAWLDEQIEAAERIRAQAAIGSGYWWGKSGEIIALDACRSYLTPESEGE